MTQLGHNSFQTWQTGKLFSFQIFDQNVLAVVGGLISACDADATQLPSDSTLHLSHIGVTGVIWV